MRLFDLTFEEWIDHFFSHPVPLSSEPIWHDDFNADYWDGPPHVTLEYITRAFENAESVFEYFSDAQLNQGFWYMINEGQPYMSPLLENELPWPDRKRAIRSISTLFEQLFAKRCSPHLSYRDEPGANPLNSVCYMWWDIFPSWGSKKDPEYQARDQEFLNVMAATLKLDAVACQESALHGLGHWHLHYPEVTQEIVDDFIERHQLKPAKRQKETTTPTSSLNPELLRYVYRARSGRVL